MGDVQVRPAPPRRAGVRPLADRFPPDKVGSEHDERESRQEEVYLTLSGAGTLGVDGETIEMKPGRYVLVSPDSKRRPAAGPEGMSFLVIGGVPGDVYEPWTPPDE